VRSGSTNTEHRVKTSGPRILLLDSDHGHLFAGGSYVVAIPLMAWPTGLEMTEFSRYFGAGTRT
jgi:hypothetical protein